MKFMVETLFVIMLSDGVRRKPLISVCMCVSAIRDNGDVPQPR